jgi:hypothetical protein
VRRGLVETATYWPALRQAYGWVQGAAKILKNEAGESRAEVRRRYRGFLGAMSRAAKRGRKYRSAFERFLRVTRSYWDGLFWCYEVADLPRTNNDLEQLFGSHRYHERRASGRKTASAGLVVRGSVRLVAAMATRLRERSGEELAPSDPARWTALRAELEKRQKIRTLGRRFRRDPKSYLLSLEQRLLKATLPP